MACKHYSELSGHCYKQSGEIGRRMEFISYADTSAGNKGTIYKAANYKLIAEIKADFYILPSGERVHPVTMWHRHKTRAWNFLQNQYPGIKKAEGKQLKFIFKL